MICFRCLDCLHFKVDCEGYVPELPCEDPYMDLPCYEPEEDVEYFCYELVDNEEGQDESG